jgi:hypothetical protein
MMSARRVAISVLTVVVCAAAQFPKAAVVTPTQGTRTVIEATSDAPSREQRAAASLVDALIQSGQLQLIDQRDDTLLPGSNDVQPNAAGWRVPFLSLGDDDDIRLEQ